MEKIEIRINEDNVRLDLALSKLDLAYTRNQLVEWISEGLILVNGKKVKKSYKVKNNDLVEIQVPEIKETDIVAEDIPLDIVYEDDDILIINKKQGMVVHPSVGHESHTLVNALMHHCPLSNINGEYRPGIVHRIDRDTSGLLMVAKNNDAHLKLSEQLKDHKNDRIYYTLVKGIIEEDSGVIKAPIGRHPVDRKKQAIVANGKEAVTHFEVLERFNNYTLLKVYLETGRTHQIRVHMKYINHPVVGDPVYGKEDKVLAPNGQLLHAKSLSLVHPKTNELMFFDSKLPKYFEDALAQIKN